MKIGVLLLLGDELQLFTDLSQLFRNETVRRDADEIRRMQFAGAWRGSDLENRPGRPRRP